MSSWPIAMSEPRIDPERLAALLDGRLTADERAALLERMAESRETMELLGDAAAIAHELAPTDPAKPVNVVPGPARWRQPSWRVAAAAAVVAAIAIPLWMQSRASAVDGNEALALLSVPIVQPTTGVLDPWRASRGDDATVTPRGRAVRVGARTIDLEVSQQAADRVSDSAFLNDISAVLVRVPASAPVVASVRMILADSSPGDRATRMVEVRNTLGSLLGREWVATGAFIEAARVAARLEDSAFFANSRSRSLMERVSRNVELDSAARQAATRALAIGWNTTPVDWAALQRELTMLLRVLVADASGDSARDFTVQRIGTPPRPQVIEAPR